MQPIEASVVVPLSPEQMWDFIRNNVLRADELLPDVVALKDFRMREDGMLTESSHGTTTRFPGDAPRGAVQRATRSAATFVVA
jgi:hypothetical protein